MLTRAWSALSVVLVARSASVASNARGSTSPSLTTTLAVSGLNRSGRGRSSCRSEDESRGLHREICSEDVKGR